MVPNYVRYVKVSLQLFVGFESANCAHDPKKVLKTKYPRQDKRIRHLAYSLISRIDKRTLKYTTTDNFKLLTPFSGAHVTKIWSFP